MTTNPTDPTQPNNNNHKEIIPMTDNNIELSDTDYRRAAAFLCHVAELDSIGAGLALDDVGLTGPGRRLMVATAMLVFDIVDDLRSPEHVAELRELTRHYAEREAAAEAGEP